MRRAPKEASFKQKRPLARVKIVRLRMVSPEDSASGENGGLAAMVVLDGGIDRAGCYTIYPLHLALVSTVSTELIRSRYVYKIIRGVVASVLYVLCRCLCLVLPSTAVKDKRADDV